MSKDDINKLIGSRLKNARKERRLTLLELAGKVGLSEGNVQRYESGNIANVSVSILVKFASALSLPPEELLGWTKSVSLTRDEETLVTNYRKLSPAGKEYVHDQVDFRLKKEAAKVKESMEIA